MLIEKHLLDSAHNVYVFCSLVLFVLFQRKYIIENEIYSLLFWTYAVDILITITCICFMDYIRSVFYIFSNNHEELDCSS